MNNYLSLAILLLPCLVLAEVNCAKTPVEALNNLTRAYKERNIEEAVNAFDFKAWARMSAGGVNADVDEDKLKRDYKRQLEKSGFPDHSSVSCTAIEKPMKNYVVVENSCKHDDGGVSYKYSYVAVKTNCGWKLAGPYKRNKSQ